MTLKLTGRIQQTRDWVELQVNKRLSREAQAEAVARHAREGLQEAQDKNAQVFGRVPEHRTYVDGVEDAPLESVDLEGGTILFRFELMAEVLRAIGEMLVQRSPYWKDDYLRGHRLFADGREVLIGEDVPEAEEYSFTNLVPYSRRLEIGRRKDGGPFLIQVENRIYERTADSAKRRFGNIASIHFAWRGIVDGRQIDPKKVPRAITAPARGKSGRFIATGGAAHNVSEVRFPTILVRLR